MFLGILLLVCLTDPWLIACQWQSSHLRRAPAPKFVFSWLVTFVTGSFDSIEAFWLSLSRLGVSLGCRSTSGCKECCQKDACACLQMIIPLRSQRGYKSCQSIAEQAVLIELRQIITLCVCVCIYIRYQCDAPFDPIVAETMIDLRVKWSPNNTSLMN